MASSSRPWYWAWRSWRVSTWALLLWSALIWPDIVSSATSDDYQVVSGAVAFVLFWVWVVGVVTIVVVRLLAYAWHGRGKDTRDSTSGAPERRRLGRAGAAVRTVFPFLAVLLLAGLLIGRPVWDSASGPSDIETVETAVEAEWYWLGETQDWAVGVSCEETEASLQGARVHVCEIRQCDGSMGVPAYNCPETTSFACAALVDDTVILVSPIWRGGPAPAAGQCPE